NCAARRVSCRGRASHIARSVWPLHRFDQDSDKGMALKHVLGARGMRPIEPRKGRDMKTIAFVGLGAMGRPMARNLIGAGFAVRGYDLNPAGLADLKAAGGVPASSAKEAFVGADAIVLMVVNAAQAEAVLFSNGALDAAPAKAIVCLMATCPP